MSAAVNILYSETTNKFCRGITCNITERLCLMHQYNLPAVFYLVYNYVSIYLKMTGVFI